MSETLLTQDYTDGSGGSAGSPVTEETKAAEAAKPSEETKPEQAQETPAEGEKKPEESGEKPAEGEKKPDEKPAGPPEKYESFKMPEGFTMDDATVESSTALFKELGLTQENAQKLVDYEIGRMKAATEANQKALVDYWAKTEKDWISALKASPDIGGPDFEKNMGVAVKAMNRFGTPELRKTLQETRMGSNPDLVRFFHNVGKAISEDAFVSGQPGGEKTIEQILYPDMK